MPLFCEEDETRTHTGFAHYPLKVARLPFRHLSIHSEVLFDLLDSEPLVGFEPTTPRLQITCSGQLS